MKSEIDSSVVKRPVKKGKRAFGCFLFLLALAVLIVISAFLMVYFYLPGCLESSILPQLAKEMGIEKFTVGVRRIGLTGVDIENLEIGGKDATAVNIQSARLDYSPWEVLSRRKINRIALSGIVLNLEVKPDGQIVLPGLPLPKSQSSGASGKSGEMPVKIGEIQIRNATINCVWKGRRYAISAEITLIPRDSDWDRTMINIVLTPRGEVIEIKSHYNRITENLEFKLNTPEINLARFADLFVMAPEKISASGLLKLTCEGKIGLNPLLINKLNITGELRESDISIKNMKIFNQGNQPAKFTVSARVSQWEISVAGLTVACADIPLKISRFYSSLYLGKQIIKSNGEFRFELPKFAVPGSRAEVTGGYLFNLTNGKNWEFHLADNLYSGKNPVKSTTAAMTYDGTELSGTMKGFDFSASGDLSAKTGNGVWRCLLFKLNAKSKPAGWQAEIPEANFKLPVGFQQQPEQPVILSMKPELKLKSVKGGFKDKDFQVSNVKLAAAAVMLPGKKLSATGNLSLDTAGILAMKGKLNLGGMSLNLPFRWPKADNPNTGSLSVSRIVYGAYDFGAMKLQVHQDGTECEFIGECNPEILPNLKVQLAGQFGKSAPDKLFKANFDFAIPKYAVPGPVGLGKLAPNIKNIEVSGEFDVAGQASYGERGFKCRIETRVKDGIVNLLKEGQPAGKITGINLNLEMENLLKLRSAPSQMLTFRQATFGQFAARDGKIEFHIESPTSYLVEKAEFGWCGGNVSANSMRIKPGKHDYAVTLYCDRVMLEKVLDQFSAGDVEAKGVMNGKLPLEFKDSKLKFKDGFLYTTPGVSGNIKLGGTEFLTAGLTPGSIKFHNMELTREALRDFNYNWAKLKFNSDEKILVVGLQLDGKPASPLPFVYSEQFGTYVKTNVLVKSKGLLRPMVLNVNFKIPLDDLILAGKEGLQFYQDLKDQ